MWPFERQRDVLRVGRSSVELWACTPRGLARRDDQALSGEPLDAAALTTGARALLARRAAGPSAVDIVVESSWLPVLSIQPGPTLLARAQVEALLLYRLAQVYGASDASTDGWSVQIEHRAGDPHGLGYALRPLVKRALLDAVTASRRKVASIQPALVWSRRRFGAQLPQDGWYLWQEQDRTLVLLFDRDRVRALNAGAPLLRQASQAMRLVEVEALRQGQPNEAGTVVAARWDDGAGASGDSPGVNWLCVAAPMSGAPRVAPSAAIPEARGT